MAELNIGKNKYGGELAVCPKCKKPNSVLYEFLKEDWRDLECFECHVFSSFPHYFPKSLQKSVDDYQRSKQY